MKTILQHIILISISVLGLSSCINRILDREPLDIISDAQVFKDQKLADDKLTLAYTKMTVMLNECPRIRNPQEYTSYYAETDNWNGPFIVNELADESLSNWIKGQSGTAKSTGITNSGGILEWWELAYEINRILNEFIEGLEHSDFSNSYKIERTAEARFLRAFNYFFMVKRYGGVPLIQKAQLTTDPQSELFAPRNSEKEVYDFIIREIDEIIGDLPARARTELGRPSQGAALALKARAALYAGSIAEFGSVQMDGLLGFSNSPGEYYQIAYDACNEIVSSGEYSLYNADADKVENFKNVFLKKNNTEVIMMIQHDKVQRTTSGGNGWIWDFFQCPHPHAWGAGNQNAPYLEMVEEFEYIDGTPGKIDEDILNSKLWTMEELWENKDPRFFATIWTQDTPWQNRLVDFHNGLILPDSTVIMDGAYEGVAAQGDQMVDKSFGTGFGVMKYLDESHNNQGERETSDSDYIIFRYGEVLLNLAEAAFELGKEGEALDAVNEIRSRAGISALSSISRDQIRHERKVELAFEGHRYWDLRRWRIAKDIIPVNRSGVRYILDYNTRKYKVEILKNFDGVTAPVFEERNYYMPITASRISNNRSLVENPGY